MLVHSRKRGGPLLSALLCFAPGTAASAQWVAIPLHTPGHYTSQCTAVGDQQQGGWRRASDLSPFQPVIWSGSAGSEVSLATSPLDQGHVSAIWEGRQAGDLNGRASIWAGTAQSRADLDPGSATAPFGSFALSMRGEQQAGKIVAPGVIDHASMWSGTAASFVDLHPVGGSYSRAYATDGAFQGGVVSTGGLQHAALWNGSAASFLDLNPYPLRESSIAGMAPGQQVGWFSGPSNTSAHAGIWAGSAQSLIDLHPFPGFGSSFAYATIGTVQVGASSVPGGSFVHAAIWSGNAASFVDLHAFLPAGYGSSSASSVYQANGVIYVGGSAGNPLTGLSEAFLWMSVPAPGSGICALVAIAAIAHRRRR